MSIIIMVIIMNIIIMVIIMVIIMSIIIIVIIMVIVISIIIIVIIIMLYGYYESHPFSDIILPVRLGREGS